MSVVVLPAADRTFRALGTDVRLIGAPDAVARGRRLILDYHARLSRFLETSELCALNADPREVVPASPLLRSAVRAALWAAERSGGLVDPCLLGALEAAGYVHSYEPSAAPLPVGVPRPAEPDPERRWRSIHVDDQAGTIARPPRLRLDLGGSGKGHVADLVDGLQVVDCGGDVRIRGTREVEIAHPLRDEPAARVLVHDGAVATSSIVARAWMSDAGPAHHLLDPRTGRPAWTGLLTATAFAPTTLEAETLAKVALLSGPDGARRALSRAGGPGRAPSLGGGVLVHADGAVETIS